MKQIKHILVAICLLVTTVSFAQSGPFGTNLTWSLIGSPNNYTLTISGIGDMDPLAEPWASYSTQITRVVIENGVTNIRGGLFSNQYNNLASVSIGESVTSIGTGTFGNCSSLASVIIPNNVTSIGPGAFQNCSSMTSFTLGKSVTSIGTYVFNGCNSLNTINFNAINYPNTYIISWGIPSQTSITLNIGNEVQRIPEYAFSNLPLIGGLTIPNSVISIGKFAFGGCSGLTSVSIGNNVTTIGESAFASCSGLISITIPSNIISIETSVFAGCSSLISVIIPNNVTSIGSSAFRDCSSLNSLIIGGGVTSIETLAFANCNTLTSITIPNNVTSIGNAVFRDCSSLSSIIIGEGVANIGAGTFFGCNNLTIINFNAKNCTGVLPFSGTQPTTLNIGNQVQIINGNLFTMLPLGGELRIPNSVTSIGNSAFFACSFSSIIIGSGVTSFGTGIFESCNSLTDVYNLSFEPQNISDKYVFSGLTLSNIRLHIPRCSGDLYRNAPVWKDFNIVEDEECTEIPVITTITLPNGKVSTAYNAQLAATGITPITWSLASGSLPSGLSLSTAGIVSGTPTTAGTFNFTVKATNSAGNVTKALSIKIEDGVGVSENEIGSICVYPSPTNGKLKIESGKLRIESVAIFDVYGRTLQSYASLKSSETTLDISHLPTGMYFVKIRTVAGEVVRKVLKE